MGTCLIRSSKTQIAIEYAYRTKEKSPETWVFWIHARNKARFVQSYRAIAKAVKLPEIYDPKADILFLLHEWLQGEESGRWLMILDNGDESETFLNQRPLASSKGSDQT